MIKQKQFLKYLARIVHLIELTMQSSLAFILQKYMPSVKLIHQRRFASSSKKLLILLSDINCHVLNFIRTFSGFKFDWLINWSVFIATLNTIVLFRCCQFFLVDKTECPVKTIDLLTLDVKRTYIMLSGSIVRVQENNNVKHLL